MLNAAVHWNNRKVCAIGVETTGPVAGYHELSQITLIPITAQYETDKEAPILSLDIRPEYEDRIQRDWLSISRIETLKNTILTASQAKMYFELWYKKIQMPIMPLVYDWGSRKEFVLNWLGNGTYNQYFDYKVRDVLAASLFINDRADLEIRQVPYAKNDLRFLCSRFSLEGCNKDSLDEARMVMQFYRQALLHHW